MSGDDGSLITFVAGSRVAGYLLEEHIGQGGMAVVFRARDERLGRPVALKILTPTLADDAGFRRRFSGESRAAATIDDPHIVPVFGAGEADGVLFIAMRYVAGGDAQSLLGREGPLPPGRVAAIISPVASALDAAHRAGLVHRDVKPSNMLMDVLPGRPDHVYLSDFGLSKAMAATTGMTATGTVLGTPEYVSPEQVRGEPADGRADQYALACSAFELLAGAPPFREDDPMAVLYAHMSKTPPPLTSRAPGLPAAVDGVLSQALEKAPDDRYASCGEFADALRDALGLPPYREATPATAPNAAHAAVTEVILPPRHPDRRPRRRLRRRIVIAAFILAVAGLTAGLLAGLPAAPLMTVPISLKSPLLAVSGDVFVVYLDGKHANAEVYGDISTAKNGEVARLYAQQFPYKNAPVRAGSVTLHPASTTATGTARYQFQVTPVLATRYRVELFQNSTSSTPFAISGTETIYVTLGSTITPIQDCNGSVCNDSQQATYMSPPSALPTEMAKTPYLYFGLNEVPSKVPKAPPPTWLVLGAGHGRVIAAQRISAKEFLDTVTFSFTVGHNVNYYWTWLMCLKNTEAEDGVGLPGNHGCGEPRVLNSTNYVG